MGIVEDTNALADLMDRINKARSLHPKPTFEALAEELGEVAKDLQEGNCPKDELLDVATVAMRMYIERYSK